MDTTVKNVLSSNEGQYIKDREEKSLTVKLKQELQTLALRLSNYSMSLEEGKDSLKKNRKKLTRFLLYALFLNLRTTIVERPQYLSINLSTISL